MMLSKIDPEMHNIFISAQERKSAALSLLPSKNCLPKAVRTAFATPFLNKYSQGLPGKRGCTGNTNIDAVERLCQKRALKLFDLDPEKWSVNVQAYSASLASLAVISMFLKPGEAVMAMKRSTETKMLAEKFFSFEFFAQEENSSAFDYEKIDLKAHQLSPKIIITNGDFPIKVDFEKLGQIALYRKGILMADITEDAGLILSGLKETPFQHSDVVVVGTEKALGGPVGTLVFFRKELKSAINFAISQHVQPGGPQNNRTAAIAALLFGLIESKPKFESLCRGSAVNVKLISDWLKCEGFKVWRNHCESHSLFIGGTDERFARFCGEINFEVSNCVLPGREGGKGVEINLRPLTFFKGLNEISAITLAELLTEALHLYGGKSVENMQTKLLSLKKRVKLLAETKKLMN